MTYQDHADAGTAIGVRRGSNTERPASSIRGLRTRESKRRPRATRTVASHQTPQRIDPGYLWGGRRYY